MSRFEARQLSCAWIPWVIAVVAMLGLNGLAPELAVSMRKAAADEIKSSQIAHPAHLAGRALNFPISSDPSPFGTGLISPPGFFLGIEGSGERPVVEVLAGAGHGRAPPVAVVS
jgi:hypothetical protein